MNFVKKVVVWLFNLVFLVVGVLAVFVVGYRFGWTLLKGGLNWGNDIPFALSFVNYLDRWWPYLPRWHYEWAGGMQFMNNYPMLITYVTEFLHRMTDFTIVQIARFFYWLSVPLAGVLIMIFARLFFNNWLIAILAGVFMILSPDSWLWTTHGGFYAAQTSFPFMVATFIFVELYFQKKKRFWFVLAAIFSGLTWLAHPMIGMAMTLGLGVYGLGWGIKKKNLFLGLTPPVLIVITGALLDSFWLAPFIFSHPQGLGVGENQLPFISLQEFMGLVPPHDSVYITSTFFAGPILVLAVLGLVFSLLKRDKVLNLVFCALAGIIIMLGPGPLSGIIKGIIFVPWVMMNVRATVLPRLFLPMIAAYGAFSLGSSLFSIIGLLIKGLKNNIVFKVVTNIIGGTAALIIVYWVFQKIVIIPKTEYYYIGYGPVYNWIVPGNVNGEIMISEGKEKLFPSIKDSLRQLLTFSGPLEDMPIMRTGWFRELAEKLNLNENDRIDIWPFGGDISAGWNTVTNIAQIPSWAPGLVNTRMVGYEQACFYDSANFRSTNNEIQDQAKWWGIKLILLGEEGRQTDPKMEANIKANFTLETVDIQNFKVLYYKVPENVGLASITNKPMVLVIGNNPPEKDVYDTVYRSLSRFGFGYDYSLPIVGKRFIDDYSLLELKKYPLVVLYGYQTHNRNKAWQLLANYVQEGGSLFVETGWQFQSQDWGKTNEKGEVLPIELPKPLPVAKTLWGNFGTNWENLTTNTDFFGPEIDPVGFAQPVWKGQPWGMALAQTADLRDFGEPLVTAGGKVVVAKGNFGQGKIVWSGMNLFGHSQLYESQSEDAVLLKIFSWLSPGGTPQEEKLNFKRITPDEVVIYLDKNLGSGQKVLFKELTTPGWQAYLGKTRLPILSTGPLWKLIPLPEGENTGELVLVYRRTVQEWFYIALSLLTAIFLLIYLLGILKIPTQLESFFSRKIKNLIKNWKNQDEDV